MITVGVRELKNRLSHYLRVVRGGDRVLVSDRGEIVAELRPWGDAESAGLDAGLVRLIRSGAARYERPNDPASYPRLARRARPGEVARWLEEERGEG